MGTPFAEQTALHSNLRQRVRQTSQGLRLTSAAGSGFTSVKADEIRKTTLTLIRRLSRQNSIRRISSIPFHRHTSRRIRRRRIRIASIQSSSFRRLLRCFLLNLLRVAVEEQIGEDIPAGWPGRSSVNGTAETENFSTEQVPHETDGVSGLVV